MKFDSAELLEKFPRLKKKDMKLLFESANPLVHEFDREFPWSGTKQLLRFSGRNSLGVFSSFEKVFFRLDEESPVYGFNRSWVGSAFNAPGYFRVDEGTLGGTYFDYRTEFPETTLGKSFGFPSEQFRKNSSPLFHGLFDQVRQVADGVLVGAAFRSKGTRVQPLDVYFVLARPIER